MIFECSEMQFSKSSAVGHFNLWIIANDKHTYKSFLRSKFKGVGGLLGVCQNGAT